jgi:hypothetical protein
MSIQLPSRDLIISFWKTLGFTRLYPSIAPKTVSFREYHMTAKSGPNGHALATSISDLSLLTRSPELMESIKIIGGIKLRNRMEGLVSQLDFLKRNYPQYPERRLRKVVQVKDKETKIRLVAILDY